MSNVNEIRDSLVQSELLAADETDALIGQWQEQAAVTDDGEQLLGWLVERQRLTVFQGEAILAGHRGPFMLGPYEVREHLADACCGQIYRAVHQEFHQPVSLKIFPGSLADDPLGLSRMQREVRVAIQLDHPNVLRTFQVGRAAKVYYLAAEDLQGESLETRLAREGRLAYPEACWLMCQAALALEHLREQEIVHRDIRPGTLWITERDQMKLIEFGAARDSLGYLDSDNESEAARLDQPAGHGMFDYVAPEQLRDPRTADSRSDIYSLGCTLYHCLTGRPPFVEQSPQRQLESHADEAPQMANWLIPEVPQGLADAVATMLAKSPGERPQTAADVDWLLRPFVEHDAAGLQTPESEWSPDYLSWVQATNPAAVWAAAETDAGGAEMPSQLSDFLQWISQRKQEERHAEQAEREV